MRRLGVPAVLWLERGSVWSSPENPPDSHAALGIIGALHALGKPWQIAWGLSKCSAHRGSHIFNWQPEFYLTMYDFLPRCWE
jgi:hypothetical protein